MNASGTAATVVFCREGEMNCRMTLTVYGFGGVIARLGQASMINR
jgi:hypothetical protein